jgi:hypothetical protein
MPRVRSAIPVGAQFSPELIDLHEFLQALVVTSGDRDQMVDTVWKPTVRTDGKTNPHRA